MFAFFIQQVITLRALLELNLNLIQMLHFKTIKGTYLCISSSAMKMLTEEESGHFGNVIIKPVRLIN